MHAFMTAVTTMLVFSVSAAAGEHYVSPDGAASWEESTNPASPCPLLWTHGQGVSLENSEIAPDPGAWEYGE